MLGDLVNRGPDSAGVLRRLMGYGHSAQCLLGNHDLHLLAAAHGIRPLQPLDTIQDILQAPDREALLHWLRQQRLVVHEQLLGHEFLLCHAGVLPCWSAQQAVALAGEVEAELKSKDFLTLVRGMYGGLPNAWSDSLQGMDRLRVIVNALTRMRFCTPKAPWSSPVKKAPTRRRRGICRGLMRPTAKPRT